VKYEITGTYTDSCSIVQAPSEKAFMRSNRLLFAAGLLAALTALVHTVAGTYDVHSPLLNSNLPQPLSLLLYACWHLVTVTLCLSAWGLLWPPNPRTLQTQAVLSGAIGITWMLFGVVFVTVALLIGGSPALLLALPQWMLLVPAGALAWSGSRRLLIPATDSRSN